MDNNVNGSGEAVIEKSDVKQIQKNVSSNTKAGGGDDEELNNTNKPLLTKTENEEGSGSQSESKNVTESSSTSSPSSPSDRSIKDANAGILLNPITQEDEDFIIFHCVSYLGAAAIQESRSEPEIHKIMAFMNENSSDKVIKVSVSVPLHADGSVIVYEEESQTEISRFGVSQIIFFARGLSGSGEWACFAFTCSHGETLDLSIFQCHVFRCDIPEAVARVFSSFARAFDSPKRPSLIPNESNGLVTDVTDGKPSLEDKQLLETSIFEVTLEFKEDDGKGNYSSAPRDKGIFKLRGSTPKHIVLTVQQIPDPSKELIVERCFGLLLSPGRHVRHSDMNLVEMLSWSIGSSGPDRKCYIITGQWDSNDPAFQSLNLETPKDSNIFMTVAVDLVVKGIQEPLRFALEVAAKIFPPSERFWNINRKHRLTHQFAIALRKVMDNKPGELYQLVNNTGLGEVDRSKPTITHTFTSFIRSRSLDLVDAVSNEDEEITDDDEPQSGEGVLTKECSDEQLTSWSTMMANWPDESNVGSRPKQLVALVRLGIPDTIRGEIWLRLANCRNDVEVMENYRRLLCKDYPNDDVIRRDITRTFSANEMFRETGGAGQELLYKLSKAYGIYDNEVGYCQGLTFLGAALLLQMPEEQAFSLLLKIMFDYEFRNLYRDGFENLHLKLYQLDRLIEDQLPEIHTHFLELGIESHMYVNQWFLTLFTAKFPLIFVFRVLDLFLLDGIKILFQVALALLSIARKDLLMLDFEGVLKYFRITLPKKYRRVEATNILIKEAIHLKVKKVKKYEAEYLSIKEQEKNQMNPLERLQLENRRLTEEMIKNEYIITNLVLHKENVDENILILEDDLIRTRLSLKEVEDFNQKLKDETNSVKDLFQREVKMYDTEAEKKSNIIAEYKRICSKLSTQLEEEQKIARERMHFFQSNLCETCSAFVSTALAIAANKQPPTNSSTIGSNQGSSNSSPTHSNSPGGEGSSLLPISYEESIKPLENELAKTKIALAEAECRNDDLNHQLALLQTELDSYKNSGPSRIWRNLPFNRESKKITVAEDSGVISSSSSMNETFGNSSNNLTTSSSLQGLSKK